MATIGRGYTFGATELVTNTKLHSLVDSAMISEIVNADIDSNAAIVDTKLATITTASKISGKAVTELASIPSGAGAIPPVNIYSLINVATNSSVPSIIKGTVFKLNSSTYGSIASFSGMSAGQIFTLVAGQASYPCVLDGGNFLLSANWMAAKAGDNLTLVWDGTNFIEIARVAV